MGDIIIIIVLRYMGKEKNMNNNIMYTTGDLNPDEVLSLDTKINMDNYLKLDLLPDEVSISTMTICTGINTIFYPENISKYIDKKPNGIIKIINTGKSNKKENGKKTDGFMNQVTVSVSVKSKEKPVSVKIFNNGSLHFTGCKLIVNMFEAAYKILEECKKIRYIIKKDKIKPVHFVEEPEILDIKNLRPCSISMINSNFVVPFEIDRPKLYIKLKSDDYICEFDTNGHSGVKIKNIEKKTTTF